MNLTDVIEVLVEERGLSKADVISIICDGIKAAYKKKYPDYPFVMVFNDKTNEVEVFLEKDVVTSVTDGIREVSARKARVYDKKAKVGSQVLVPFEEKVGRIEVLAARQLIASRIRELEQQSVYDEYKEKEGTIVTGIAHKRDRGGYSVKIGDVMALLPFGNTPKEIPVKMNLPLKALLKEVLLVARGDYQLILDRSSSEFIQTLLEVEIPEIFERVVEIKKIVRIAGYKTKVLVMSHSSDVDPVGTCVGVGGVRIRPILKELGGEKVDLIAWSEDPEILVKNCLKPAEIDKVELLEDKNKAIVWLAEDQRAYAIGKMGQNIALASKVSGIDIQLQDLTTKEAQGMPFSAESVESVENEDSDGEDEGLEG